MPYKLSPAGFNLIHANTAAQQSELQGLTDLQIKALDYLSAWKGVRANNDAEVYVDAAEVAQYYSYPNGQHFRGVLASLYNKGLLSKCG